MEKIITKTRDPQSGSDTLIESCVTIVTAYVGRNSIVLDNVPKLIGDVHRALRSLAGSASSVERNKPISAVDPKKSVTNDYIICLEDGKHFKTLKRHLRVHYGMTPEEYRKKWGLASDYPMVARNYAARRSELAKEFRLGWRRK